MALRYPLAVLGAWGVFLLLVRSWAEREREQVRIDEELADLSTKDDVFDGAPGRRVLNSGESSSGWGDWLDWLNPFDLLDAEGGCLLGLVIGVAVIALGGVFVAVGGLIMQAEILLAEVLLDVLLVSALNKRLHKLHPRWWAEGTLRQTYGPVLITMIFLAAVAFLLQRYAPEATSIGGVWRYWRGPE